MDAEILHAIWFDCKDLSDSQHKLLLALAYHCHHSLTCFPSIPRLAVMIRKKPRQTRTLLRKLARVGYITIKIQRGRGKSNLYTINRQKLLPVLDKIGSPDCRSKPAIAIAAELLMEEEREKEDTEAMLLKLGLTPGSQVWVAAMNGHIK